MKIVKVIYAVEYTHILTFSTEYRAAIAPFFKMLNLSYGFENLDTFEENIRLVFNKDGYMVQCRKDASILTYEGPFEDILTSSSPPIDFFLDIVGSISKIEGFGKFNHHQMQIFAVDLIDSVPELERSSLAKSHILKALPKGQVDDFMVVFESSNEGKFERQQFGNFRKEDVIKYQLDTFKSLNNSELHGPKIGYLYNFLTKEKTESISFSKYKSILDSVKTQIYEFSK